MGTKNLNIKLDFRSTIPIYLQIVEGVRQMVADGDLHRGDQLPTVRELATELRVNFNTVARAYRLLDEAGLISTQRGRGTYIWEEPNEEMMRKLRQEGLEGLVRQFLGEAGRMGFSAEEVKNEFEAQIRPWQETKSPPEVFESE